MRHWVLMRRSEPNSPLPLIPLGGGFRFILHEGLDLVGVFLAIRFEYSKMIFRWWKAHNSSWIRLDFGTLKPNIWNEMSHKFKFNYRSKSMRTDMIINHAKVSKRRIESALRVPGRLPVSPDKSQPRARRRTHTFSKTRHSIIPRFNASNVSWASFHIRRCCNPKSNTWKQPMCDTPKRLSK